MWSTIFAGLTVAMVAVLVAGLIRPAWFTNKKTGDVPRRSELATGSIFLVVVFAGLSMFLAPDGEVQPISEASKPTLMAAKQEVGDPRRLTGETKALWKQLVAATKPCDDAAKEIAVSAQSGFDVYRLYRQAKGAQQLCSEAAGDLRSLGVPASAQDGVADAFEEAIQGCSNSYMVKSATYQKMLVVLNGDMRPSAISDLEDSMRAAETLTMGCTIGVVQAAAKGDVPLSTFES